MIRQKVMLTIMSVCLVNINISAAELLPEESGKFYNECERKKS